MTGTPIMELGSRIGTMGYGQPEKQNRNIETSASFQDALSQAGQSQLIPDITPQVRTEGVADKGEYLKVAAARMPQDLRVSTSLQDARVKTEGTANPNKTETETKETSGVKDAKETGNDKDVNKAPSEEAEEQIKDTVAEKLGISKEELEEAMETLGLTVADLANPANLALFVQDENDLAALLMDENLLATVQDLAAEVQTILDADAQVMPVNTDVLEADVATEFFDVLPTEETIEEPVIEAKAPEAVKAPVQAPVQEEKPVEVTVVDERTPDAEIAVNRTEGQAGTQTGAQTGAQTGDSQTAFERSAQPQEVLPEIPVPTENQAATPFVANVVADTQAQAPVSAMSFSSGVDAADIIKQIGEYVNIHKTNEMTEMEIALNPANLGNVHLRVAADAQGNVTATLTAQNESVRDALMMQAMELKENLESQGVKIEAVEVTVASHEFEQNMNDGQQNQTEELYEKEVAKATRRRIVVDGLQDAQDLIENGDLTDAEKVEVDMMARRGNSVNFRA
ncbi:MAG: flagellar hook-length control protein FliK [Lachnospiraceae bacterium]|nr:flagellar hook-length control protein FliK [Lachnospiraceae bacterium]